MNRLIAAITGLHVLVHGIFGCCGHSLAAPRVAVPSHCCQAEHGDHDESASDRDHADQTPPAPGPHECVHAFCHWLSGDSSPIIGELDLFGALPLAALHSASTSLTAAAEFLPADILGTSFAPPLRPHLALGVLLI
ncbi:MAG: hypothetical protein WD971_02250 [Pirellulales bacterium]